MVSDPDVLNISLFIPLAETTYSVDEAYEEIAGLIQLCWPSLPIKTYEIVHSYCPGKFDLSVDDQNLPELPSGERRMPWC